MRALSESTTTKFHECHSSDPDWQQGDFYDDLAAQFNRLATTFGLKAEWHRSESRRKTQRGRELPSLTSRADSSR